MSLRLKIVTPERQVYSQDVDMVVAPGIEGQLAILPRHAPLVTALTSGELRVKHGDEEASFAISSGFLEVQRNQVTVLAYTAEHAKGVELARTEAAQRRAEERQLVRTREHMDFARAEAALRRSMTRIKVSKLRRRRGRQRAEVRQHFNGALTPHQSGFEKR
jgi:F-type H+-transporting ATPase subunit epsilon